MKCLILAAGRGSRLGELGKHKPLIPLLGVPLIERVIRSAMDAGIREFYVVGGYRGEELRAFLDELAGTLPIKLVHIYNSEWERGNGLSVLAAREFLMEPFVLLMADHLFDPEILRALISENRRPQKAVTLVVDERVKGTWVEEDDVTKVLIHDGSVVDIGKDLQRYNAFDTGIFICSPVIFNVLEEEARHRRQITLTDGVRVLASKREVKAWSLRDGYWIDVDNPKALYRAERLLLDKMQGKRSDGPVSRHINRHISRHISTMLARRRIAPNAISILSFLMCMTAASLMVVRDHIFLAMGGLLTQFASILDGCDGEVARLTYRQSEYGAWLDAVLDRYADGFLVLAMSWHAYVSNMELWIWFLGGLALLGSYLVSYTADKYDALMRPKGGDPWRIGRDVRLFVISLGALLNLTLVTLGVLAALMNAEVIRRVFLLKPRAHAKS
jgi:CDP-L-myo-inositol myo-inositolphosphotransferase